MTNSSITLPNKRVAAIRRGKIKGSMISWPSGSYEENCGSYTYRISESVFGSLLASYILGFVGIGLTIGLGAAEFKPFAELLQSQKLIQLLQSCFISVSFAYLTAGYYVIYHSSILTMPHLPAYRLKTDFGIALLQAVFFGLSMIQPDGFLFFIGISWLRVFARQRAVFQDLSMVFTANLKSGDTGISDHHQARVETIKNNKLFKKTLFEVNSDPKLKNCLGSWLPVSWIMWTAGIVACLVGAISECRHFYRPLHDYLILNPVFKPWCQIVLYFLLTVMLGYKTNQVLTQQADHPLVEKLQDPEKPEGAENPMLTEYAIDKAAEQLVEKLKQKTSA